MALAGIRGGGYQWVMAGLGPVQRFGWVAAFGVDQTRNPMGARGTFLPRDVPGVGGSVLNNVPRSV